MGSLSLDVVNSALNHTRAAPSDSPAVGNAVERSSASDVYVGCAVFSGCRVSNLKGLVNDATRRLVEAAFRLVNLCQLGDVLFRRSMRCYIDCRGFSREQATGHGRPWPVGFKASLIRYRFVSACRKRPRGASEAQATFRRSPARPRSRPRLACFLPRAPLSPRWMPYYRRCSRH
jgi:hypothetical protein